MKTFVNISLVVILGSCGMGVSQQVNTSSFATLESGPSTAGNRPDGYIRWRENFRSYALARGVNESIFEDAFDDVGVNNKVIELDNRQAEFHKTAGEYLDGISAPSRYGRGREMAQQYGGLLNALESKYGVSREVIIGVWGMETAFGRNMGNIKIAESLGSLAYDGRRRSFAETQLITALKIAESNGIDPDRMIGSWAGALGHTQFIPTSYQALAVDGNGDGVRDLWNLEDALASTANYLAKNGWQRGEPWGYEVNVPSSAYNSLEGSRSPAAWGALGIKRADGTRLTGAGNARIFAPEGLNGPVFMIFKNFDVIKTYNNSSSYALGVGYLGSLSFGGPLLKASWPSLAGKLSSKQIEKIQARLKAEGYAIEKVDGIYGEETGLAIREYEKAHNLPPNGAATIELYQYMF